MTSVQLLSGGQVRAAIYKNIHGVSTLLAAKTVPLFHGALQFKVLGNKLRLSLDGHLLLSVTDKSITGPGLAGIRATAGAGFRKFVAG